MTNFEIKITGSGTKNQIETRLLEFVRELQIQNEDFESLTFEDDIIHAEITQE